MMFSLRTILAKGIYWGLYARGSRGFAAKVHREFRARQLAQWEPAETVRKRQLDKLRRLLSHVVKAVPYFRQMHAKGLCPDWLASLEEMSSIPPLTKDFIRAEPRSMIDETLPPGALLPRYTGGSSGEPLQFLVSPSARIHASASEIWGDSLAGYRPGDPVAVLWGAASDMRKEVRWKGRLHHFLVNKETLITNRMTEERMAGFVVALRRFRPRILLGYVSSLVEFAHYLKSVEPAGLGVKVRSIISAAEPLSDAQRSLLETVYQCPVFNRYGAREGGLMAMECDRHQGLHINCESFWIDLEPCIELGSGVFRLLITNLDEFGMPFIRYEQGDYTAAGLSTCSCGRGYPTLATVTGRTLSVLRLPDGTRVVPAAITLILGAAPVRSYQVVQEKDYSLQVELVPTPEYSNSAEQQILAGLRRFVGDLPIKIRLSEEIMRTRSGKLLPIVSHVQ